MFHIQRFFFLDREDKYTKNKIKKPLPTPPVKKVPPVSTEKK
jgi:hypothetical protein